MDTSKEDPERRWVAQGQQSYNPEKDEAVNVSLGHGFLSRVNGAKKVYKIAAMVLVTTILYSLIYLANHSFPKVFVYPAPTPDTRLLRFSQGHIERIPSVALDHLLSYRNAVNCKGEWTASIPAEVDVQALRTEDQHGVLKYTSDDAIRALAGREGYRVGYVDITDTPKLHFESLNVGKEDPEALPYRPVNASAHPEYQDLVERVSADRLKAIVHDLSVNFSTRYYRGPKSDAPSKYIQEYFSRLPNVTVSLFKNNFNQPNVISRLSPLNATDDSPTIVLGGHLDSTSSAPWFKAPGADDDASGTAVMMHVMEILAESGWVQTRAKYPIEGHAYGGEEGGLLGSSAVAHAYKTQERLLRGMLNLEMVGWQPEHEGSSTITVLVDPNQEMSEYMEEVVKEYVPTAVVRSTTCGYGCSDHYSWSSLGYPVVCLASYGPNDGNLNPNYHSINDKMEYLNFERMADFAKAALAWVVQVGSL